MGPYLSAPITTKETSEGRNAKLRFGVTSMQGWRNTMEDAHITNLNVDRGTAIFGVFDGHGGKEVAIFTARHIATELVLNSSFQSGNTERALAETFLRMDVLLRTVEGIKEVFKICKGLPDSSPVDLNVAKAENNYAGCTAVVALLQGSRLFVANAGDSRCVLARRGVAIEMSTDHKPDNPEELARIKAAGSYVAEGRVNGAINLSRSIGDLEYKNVPSFPPERQAVTAAPEIKNIALTQEDDFLVLCCDGIWDILTSQACVDFIYERLESRTLGQICEDLCDRCMAHSTSENEGRGCDNMTAIIVAWNKPID